MGQNTISEDVTQSRKKKELRNFFISTFSIQVTSIASVFRALALSLWPQIGRVATGPVGTLSFAFSDWRVGLGLFNLLTSFLAWFCVFTCLERFQIGKLHKLRRSREKREHQPNCKSTRD